MTAAHPSVSRRPVLGALVIIVAVLAAAFAVLLLVVPPAVAPDVWSYPLTAAPFIAGQVLVAVNHLVLAAGLFAAWRVGLAGHSRLAAIGGISSTVAMTLFGILELVAAGAANDVGDTGFVEILDDLYGAATVLLALCSIVFGIAILRGHAWRGFTRVTVLVTGIYLVVPMIPAQFGPQFFGLIALVGWSLLYIGLGIGLRRGVSGPAK
ncbi:MAG: hypothetical protein ABI435_05325 [Pseudolysinimonas sp.]